MKLFWISILVVITSGCTLYADHIDLTEKGNTALTEGEIEEALKLYKEAEVEKPRNPILDYNIGTALYHQTKYEEALQRYQKALSTDDSRFQADGYYNMGNTFFRSEKYPEAIQAYQKTLEIDPDDVDAKYNLELARKKLKEQAQQKQQDQKNQDQQDQKQQDQQQQDQQDQQQQDQQQEQQQDQQNQDQQEQEEQQQQQDQEQQQEGQEGEEGEENQQPRQAQQEQKGMSKEDAERILNAIAGDEKELQKKVRQVKVKSKYKGKDW